MRRYALALFVVLAGCSSSKQPESKDGSQTIRVAAASDLARAFADVGKALVRYLRRGRPTTTSVREVFLCARPPHRKLRGSATLCGIVRRAFDRAGVNVPIGACHVLRHTLATTMLRAGSSLPEIGQVLRHRSPETTAIYAKVDFDALRRIAPAWPRAGR